MKQIDRSRLTSELRSRVAQIAADLRAKMLAPGPARARAEKLRDDEQVGESFELWTDLLSRRAAVLWVLKSVYVRVLEDRGLVSPGRILDPESQQLFEKLAPNLGETAFLRWVYRDLGSEHGGLPELFAPQPAEVAWPSDELSRGLITYWRHRDADTGRAWSFAEERFEGELMGDLYQELDPVVKERFALCQTPDFVRGFILDRTLTPAIETFGADKVRLLDPACGSGHFLIDGLKRLVAATEEQHPDWERQQVVKDCLGRVVGMDINDYACALARARLVMTAAELCTMKTLVGAAEFHPHVYWADGLEQVEREQKGKAEQLDLLDVGQPKAEPPRATLTRPEVRAVLVKVLEPRFHAVVANPPYIAERDPVRKEYHRKKVGKEQRYVSAYREYSLASPFTERCFQLAVKEGFVGLITSNNFMKREFGKPLIEKVLAGIDLTLVVDTSQARIPYHGTSTVILFGRNRTPSPQNVRAVMGKRGDTDAHEESAKGQVWLSVEEATSNLNFENEFISVGYLPRKVFEKHPWSLGGGGAAELRNRLESSATSILSACSAEIGVVCVLREDDLFILDDGAERRGVASESVRSCLEGWNIREWGVANCRKVIWPYDAKTLALSEGDKLRRIENCLWSWRSILERRSAFGKTQRERGLAWCEYSMLFRGRAQAQNLLVFSKVASHNQFALYTGGLVPIASTHIVLLPEGKELADHLALLGLLNSSTAAFWMRQVYHDKGAGGVGGGYHAEKWSIRLEFDATKLAKFPIAKHHERTLEYARELDALARQRVADSPAQVLADRNGWTDADSLRVALDVRRERDIHRLNRMVALQEELDWLCYLLYDIDAALPILAPEEVEPVPPNWLPWVLNLAERDAEIRAALERSEDPGELPTAWFERHGWVPLQELPKEASSKLRDLIRQRRERIRGVGALKLIETATHKRRWFAPNHEAEEKGAIENWLVERIEAVARERDRTFTLEQIAALLQGDSRLLALAELLTRRPDFSLSHLIDDSIQKAAVPNHRFHVYKEPGLEKRIDWEHTWADQRREDAGEKVVPEPPPPYAQADFLKAEYWKLRGALDVPKERFIAFTEVPGRTCADTLYGWAGWTSLQRLRALLGIDEELEDAGVPLADRIGVLDSAWRLLPDAAREDATAANRLKAELQALLGSKDGPSPQMLLEWRERFPPPGTRTSRKATKTP